MSFLPTHLPRQPNRAQEDYGQFFLHTLVQAAPSAAYPTTQLPLVPPQKPSDMAPSITHTSPSWGLCSSSVTSHSPVHLVTTASPVLSSHFTDRGTEVLRTGQVTGKAGVSARIQTQVSLVPKLLTSERHICWLRWAKQIRDEDLGVSSLFGR